MALRHTYLLGLLLSTAFVYACDSTDGALGDGGSAVIPGGSLSGTTPGGAMMGGTVGGSPTGGTTGGQAVPGGIKPGGTPGTAIPGGPVTSPTGGTGTAGATGGGDAGVPGGAGDGGAGAGEGGTTPSTGGSCPGLPAVTDYAAKGPFGDVMMKSDVVTEGEGCTLFRPGASLGKDGYKHPIAVWGNGILTDPPSYQKLLGHIASHGFVVIACNSSMPEQPCLNMCMEWLVKQNTSGDMAGKLDTSKEITIGYSWGGGAQIDTSGRPNVKASISFHGMPPRQTDSWDKMHAPLLLFTSIGDTFVSAEQYVTPNYNSSKVTTFYATLQENVGHVYPCDEGSACDSVGGLALGGPSMGAIKEQAPAVAWLRYWVCGDQNAKKYFFGSNCELCKSPWKSQSKPMGAFN